jgi:hypothetical protein
MEGNFKLKELEVDLSFVLRKAGSKIEVEFLDGSADPPPDPARVNRIRLKYEAETPFQSLRIDPNAPSLAFDHDRMQEIKHSVAELFGDTSEINIPTILRPHLDEDEPVENANLEERMRI